MGNEDRPESSSGEQKKRRLKGKVFITPERCKGCGYCVEFCPTHVLALAESFNQKGYHPPTVVDAYACNGCGLCGMYCPDFAIFGVRIKRKKEKAGEDPDESAA